MWTLQETASRMVYNKCLRKRIFFRRSIKTKQISCGELGYEAPEEEDLELLGHRQVIAGRRTQCAAGEELLLRRVLVVGVENLRRGEEMEPEPGVPLGVSARKSKHQKICKIRTKQNNPNHSKNINETRVR